MSSHRVTVTSSPGTQLPSTRASQDGRTVLRLRNGPKSLANCCRPKRISANACFFDTLDELKSYSGVAGVMLSKLVLVT